MTNQEARLVKWEPRWTSPVVESDCPSCGIRRERQASSWAGNIDGTLRARFRCEDAKEPECWRIFDVRLTVPELSNN